MGTVAFTERRNALTPQSTSAARKLKPHASVVQQLCAQEILATRSTQKNEGCAGHRKGQRVSSLGAAGRPPEREAVPQLRQSCPGLPALLQLGGAEQALQS